MEEEDLLTVTRAGAQLEGLGMLAEWSIERRRAKRVRADAGRTLGAVVATLTRGWRRSPEPSGGEALGET